MKIIKIHLQNFKRFSDLLIENIPTSSKLVLLIGSNGSGKSCIFDAFSYVNGLIKQDIPIQTEEFISYFRKIMNLSMKVFIQFDNQIEIDTSKPLKINILPNNFYGRTSFRQIPRLTRTMLGQAGKIDLENDSDRPKTFIERDNRFENDIENITGTILNEFFLANQPTESIKQKYISPINNALTNIFGEGNGTKLQLIKIIPPLEGKVAQITFQKGDSEIHYNFLSAGEKEIVNLLFNLLSRTSHYQDTIYFLDEIDLHLNTKLQFNLLKEITENWIPENCQLWTASHSLGFIEYAKQSDNASIIDFDDLDFDLPRILVPEIKDKPEIYEIAVGKEFLPSLFRQMNIFFVENTDKTFYANLGISNTIFVSENNRNNVYHKVRTTQYQGIVDRDFLSDDDISQIRKYYPNLFILEYYSIENYLYHPDNLAEYYTFKQKTFDKDTYISLLIEAKNQAKNSFISSLALKRTEYPYFGEPEYIGNPLQNRFKNKQENELQASLIAEMLNNDEFEIFYKVLPMKSYCTQLPQRQNISKNELAKTQWFKAKIEQLIGEGNNIN
jgi:AAA15 family ATPase/GTPase